MIWNATPNGKFLVRSAYKLAMDKLREAVALMMGQYKKKKNWRKIWSLQVPNKVKHFAWRDL